MQSCSSAHSVLTLLLIIFTVGCESAVDVVTVEYKATAVLPCSGRCSGVASWTPSDKSSDFLVQCNQTSCRSVKEGYQMNHTQYLKGDLSLIITGADFSKRGWYTCDCDGRDQGDVKLQIEPRITTVQMEPGDPLVMELEVSDPVEVVYSRTEADDQSSDQICTVIGGSLQCKPEYTNRISLSSSDLELRGTEESDSGVYIVRDNNNKEDLHIYTVTIKDQSLPAWAIGLISVAVVAVVVMAVLVLRIKNRMSKNLERKVNNWKKDVEKLESQKQKLEQKVKVIEQMKEKTAEDLEKDVQEYVDLIQKLEKQIVEQKTAIQTHEDKIKDLKKGHKLELMAERKEIKEQRKQLKEQKKEIQKEWKQIKKEEREMVARFQGETLADSVSLQKFCIDNPRPESKWKDRFPFLGNSLPND